MHKCTNVVKISMLWSIRNKRDYSCFFSVFNIRFDTECCKLAYSNYFPFMRIKLLVIFSVLILVVNQAVDAQKVILLRKSGKTKNVFYKVGDKITIRIAAATVK